MIRAFVWLVIRFRYLVVLGCLAGAVASALLLPGLGGSDDAELGGLVAGGTDAAAAEQRSLELFRVPLVSRAVVVHRNPDGLSAREQLAIVRRAVRVSRGDAPLFRTIALAVPVLNTGGLVPSSRERSTTGVTYLYFRESASLNATSSLARSYAASVPVEPGTFAGATGPAPARLEQWHAIEDALPLVELGTLLLIAVVVGVTFRSVGAPLLALAAAGIAYLVAVGVVSWAAAALGVTVPREVEPVMLVLLLGVVTDYAVFYLFGTSRRLEDGAGRVQAAEQTAVQVTPIVLTTGLIVTFGTATILVGRLEFFRAFGPGAALTVLVSVAVSVTFIPAALAVFGRLVFWPSAQGGRRPERERRSFTLRVLTRRPVALVAGVATVAALVVAASGLREANLGFTLLTGLPGGSTVERALFEAGRGFAPGIVSPTEVLVEGDGVGGRERALVRLQSALEELPGVAGVIGPREVPPQVERRVFVRDDAARYALIWNVDPFGGAAVDRLQSLRGELPDLLERAGLPDAQASLAGDTALAAETVDSIVRDIRWIALAALLVNLLFLAVFLRALLAPLYLLAASALGLAAALGATAFVFHTVLGYGDLTYYVPFAAAVLLLSLGSDYTLFVVGRIWQEAERRPVREAIVVAMPRASRTITIAGIALAGSFALLALVPLRPFREFAFAMAVGVLIDTFVVRSLLVPSLVAFFGERSWWPAAKPPVREAARRE